MNRNRRGLLVLMAAMLMLLCAAASAAGNVKVYFNGNYPGAPVAASQEVEAGQTLTQPDDPTREGYRFDGWYTSVVCNRVFDFSAPVTENLRLFAGWTPITATYTYHMNFDGADDLVQAVTIGEKPIAPQAPVREGFTFVGWCVNAQGTHLYDFDQAANRASVVLYAGWTQKQAAVTYVLYDDETMSAQVEFGSVLQRPEDPTRADYAFDDWYTSVAGSEKFDFTVPVAEDLRLYAHWTQTAFNVTFDGNLAGTAPETVRVSAGAALESTPAMTREGYELTGWFVDAAATQAFDLTTIIAQDMTLYAGWQVKSYTITFDENYAEGSKTTAQVEYGQPITAPADPTRSGFDFAGWYLDADASKLLDANTPITGDMTVYAKWQSQVEASGDRIYTYLLNDGTETVYETQTYTSTRRVKAPDAPSRAGYYFLGWAKDAAGETMYDFSSERSQSSITMFARWQKGYTFEAEYTFLDGKPGQGTSDNCAGTDLIQSPKDVLGNGTQMGMSNGYYVGKLYYNGAFLVFDIHSDREVDDVTLALRLTPDLFDMRFTDESWQVLVNDVRVEYGKLNLIGAVAQTDFDAQGNAINGDMNKRPFENYVIATGLHLNEGVNQIRLVTNNKEDHGGTFNAESPLIDCMYLFTDATLTWETCYPENVGKTLSDVTYDVTYDVTGSTGK